MKTIIWPVYLNSEHTRGEGRKLSLDESVSNPKIREISQALRKLKIQHIVDHSKSYPGSWWENSGRVVVEQDEHYDLPPMECARRSREYLKILGW